MAVQKGKHEIMKPEKTKTKEKEATDTVNIAEKVGVNKSKLPTAAKIGLVVVAVVAIAVVAAVLFVNSKIDKLGKADNSQTALATGETVVQSVDNTDIDITGLEQRESGSALPEGMLESNKNVVNILLLGTDMKMQDGYDLGRCDATIICSLNKKTGDIKLVSFERALGVPIPDYEDEKLNSILWYGGEDFMVETIENCFLVDIDGYVHIGFETFPAIIDAIGGIDIELDKNEVYFMNQYLEYKDAPDLVVGMNHLNGIATWSYCRLRDGDGDFERQGRVRNAIAAVVDRLKTLSLSELNELADTVLPMVKTNLTKKQLTSLILSSPKFLDAEVSQLMVPEKEEDAWSYQTNRGEYMLGVDFEEWAKKISKFLYE